MTFSMEIDEAKASRMAFVDDMSGKELNPSLVKAARGEEMEEFKKHTVYKKVPLNQCLQETGRQPIGVRWVDVNKGDDESPNVRCRIVAKYFNIDKRPDLFAATPPTST